MAKFCILQVEKDRSLLEKCAVTALSSKLIHQQKDYFAQMVVDAVLMLDDLLPLNMIGIKQVQGGALEVDTNFSCSSRKVKWE